jgi:hypothetical protein
LRIGLWQHTRFVTRASDLGIALAVTAAAAATACEDGPSQSYRPAPPGAEDRVNDGKNPGVVDSNAKNPLDQNFGGQTALDTCVGDKKRQVLTAAFTAPIIPPNFMAGVDLRGKGGEEDYSGLSIDDALDAMHLCQGNTYFDPNDQGYGQTTWGDAKEVWARWVQVSRRMDQFTANPGYTGAFEFDGPEIDTPNDLTKKVKYHFVVAEVPKRSHDGGKTWEDFYVKFDPNTGNLEEHYVQAFANGMIATFDPVQMQFEDDGTPVDCATSGRCNLQRDDTTPGTLYGVRPVGMYIHFPNFSAPPSVGSKPDQMFITPLKLMPFASTPMFLKLDTGGPVAQMDKIGDAGKSCSMHLLMTDQDLEDHCINVYKDGHANHIQARKWFGGIAHDFEHYLHNVQGVGLEFTDLALPWNDVVRDGVTEAKADTASAFFFDIRATGRYLNDSAPNPKKPGSLVKDFHGLSAVFWEFARSVQADISSRLPTAQRHDLGDPACLYPRDAKGNLPPDFDRRSWRPAAGCTGFEGMVTLAAANTGNPQYDKLRQRDVLVNGAAAPLSVNADLGIGFHPGDPAILFCSDPGDIKASLDAGKDPAQVDGCVTGPVWDTAFKRVVSILGQGDVDHLPAEMRDRRYFFRQYGVALVKYMRVAGQYGPDYDATKPIDLSNVTIDEDSLFFDNVGDGEAERVEYVERTAVAKGVPPIDFEYEADVHIGNQRYTHFYQRLDRPEVALYTAVSSGADKDTPGKKPLLLTEVFGSPIFGQIAATPAGKACVAGDASQCPQDGFGRTVDLSPYALAFSGSPLALGTKLVKVTRRREDIRMAELELPNFVTPPAFHEPTAATLDPIHVLVPWVPKSPGIGYSVPVTGQRDDFVTTAQLDFTGITETFTLKVDYVDKDGNPDVEGDGKNVVIKAVQTQDFLGRVFLCRDPATGDLLTTRMYDSAEFIVEWLKNHPGAQDACKIIVRYSPYNNYPDIVTSLVNGVKVGVNQGGGYGRVVDATLYLPQ